MELTLQREILRLKPEYTVEQVEEKAKEIFNYWVDSCLEDVMEAEDE